MTAARSSPYVVVGAGIHGLSTAYHLAKELRARGLGDGGDILVLEKSEPGAGASGIACGVVRNNYFQPAMSELMQACVEVWESDPEAFHYNPVGYIALGPAGQEPDLTATYERQERIGYGSELILGERDVDAHMKALFPDWRARGVTVCLHEHQGGFAFNRDSVLGLLAKATAEGVRVENVSFYEPVWDTLDDYLAQSENILAVQIFSMLAVTASYVYQRDSTPPPDVESDDHHVKIGIQLQL